MGLDIGIRRADDNPDIAYILIRYSIVDICEVPVDFFVRGFIPVISKGHRLYFRMVCIREMVHTQIFIPKVQPFQVSNQTQCTW